MRGVGAAEEGDDPGGGGLVAGYEAFGAELSVQVSQWVSRQEWQRGWRTMPVVESTSRERVSTETT